MGRFKRCNQDWKRQDAAHFGIVDDLYVSLRAQLTNAPPLHHAGTNRPPCGGLRNARCGLQGSPAFSLP
jgi:hypothetical protein